MKNILIPIIALSLNCFSETEQYPSCSAMGEGVHYACYHPKVADGQNIVSEISKDGVLYQYKQFSLQKYAIVSNESPVVDEVCFFDQPYD